MKTLLLTTLMLFSTTSTIHSFEFKTIDGKSMSFSAFKGKKSLSLTQHQNAVTRRSMKT